MHDLMGKRQSKGFLILVGVAACLLAGMIGWAWLKAGSAQPTKATEGPASNLGRAPAGEAFVLQYQAKLEQMVNQRLTQWQDEQAKQQAALAAQQKAALERIEASAQALPSHTSASPGGGEGEAAPKSAPAEYPATTVKRMKEALGTSGKPAGWSDTFLGTPADVTEDAASKQPAASGKAKATKPRAGTYVIPEDGWAHGRLVNGVVATQGGEFRYTQIKLVGEYHSANDQVHNVDGCVARGEASASVGEGRIYVKPIKLTCTLPNARTKSWETAGYVVDKHDGMQGLAATLVNNPEKKLFAAMAAAGLERGGGYLASREVTSTFSSATGAAAGVVTGNAGRYLLGGIAEGAGAGLREQVKEYAELMRPSVQAPGATEVTVHFTSTQELPEGGEAISTVRAAE